jgi:hypothetical protein
LAFAATSFAVGRDPEPRLRANLPAAALPPIVLDQSDAVAINNIVGKIGSIAGITPESYRQVRLLTTTAAGPLYLIPGSRGTCISLAYAAVCGDPGGPKSRLNAIVTLDSFGDRLIGGGVADDSVDRVEVVVRGHEMRKVVPVTGGVFSIDVSVPGFEPGKGVEFIAH